MPIYVLMTKLGPDAMHDPRGRKAVGRAWIKKVRKLCPEVTWIAHYAILISWTSTKPPARKSHTPFR